MAVFVARDIGPILSVQASADIFVEHFCEAGLGASFRSGVAFADDVCPKIGANQGVAIYAISSGSGQATNVFSAIATIKFFQVMA